LIRFDLCAAFALLATFPLAGSAVGQDATYAFQLVAAKGDAAPGTASSEEAENEDFDLLYAPSFDGLHVAFTARYSPGRAGVFTTAGGTLRPVALDWLTWLPVGDTFFVSLDFTRPSMDAGTVVFSGMGPNPSKVEGIFADAGSGLFAYASTSTIVPDYLLNGTTETEFTSLRGARGRQGSAAFDGVVSTSAGHLYRGVCLVDAEGTVQTIADVNTFIPGSTFGSARGKFNRVQLIGGFLLYSAFDPPLADGDSVIFHASGGLNPGDKITVTFENGSSLANQEQRGIYAHVGGALKAIADRNSFAPGFPAGSESNFKFFGVDPVIAETDGGGVLAAFTSVAYNGVQGVFAYDDGVLRNVAVKLQSVTPDAGVPFANFSSVAVGGTRLVFTGSTGSGHKGIYAWDATTGALETVIDTDDLLDGLDIAGLEIDRQAVSPDGGSFGFLAKFVGGAQAIYVASRAPTEVELDIDIKPGSDPNALRLGRPGLVAVAIFGADGFDVTEVDVDSLELAGADVARRGKEGARPQVHLDDVNDDGVTDLVVHFERMEMDAALLLTAPDGSQAAELVGALLDGTDIRGHDTVVIVPR
jgi:hypothetical protein